ncbi:MAG: hypothetical protein HOG03_23315 [Desulfobacula sp.]|uniref:hypothetical protein n=1 Tax=Desulfobacula sp. TaxID=2593537 RepID=UPI001ED075DA|nr:hypothetical protein [Desulfobacula sp.]MBT4876299.1 hypothetical protein [Desulfobacula sp.]MBT5546471.1 hypothetical protein [Desulfobacula sp.]MBT5972714.1 hypothetical protein [Desulfobacula sp.]
MPAESAKGGCKIFHIHNGFGFELNFIGGLTRITAVDVLTTIFDLHGLLHQGVVCIV